MSRRRSCFPAAASVLLAWVLGAAAAQAGIGVTVTYVANEGILLEGGGAKVPIDALVDDGVVGYPTPSPEIQAKLEAAEPPFDGPARGDPAPPSGSFPPPEPRRAGQLLRSVADSRGPPAPDPVQLPGGRGPAPAAERPDFLSRRVSRER